MLSLLPEALHVWAHRGDAAAAASPGSASLVELSVEGMGCTACTVKAKGALDAIEGVVACDVLLEEQAARLRCDGPRAVDEAIAALGQAGFQATLKQRRPFSEDACASAD